MTVISSRADPTFQIHTPVFFHWTKAPLSFIGWFFCWSRGEKKKPTKQLGMFWIRSWFRITVGLFESIYAWLRNSEIYFLKYINSTGGGRKGVWSQATVGVNIYFFIDQPCLQMRKQRQRLHDSVPRFPHLKTRHHVLEVIMGIISDEWPWTKNWNISWHILVL